MSKKREDSEPEQPVDAGRRRLLGMAMYVPPLVIGAITLSQAGCQPEPTCSCAPNNFQPCAMPVKPGPKENSTPSQHSPIADPTPEG